MPQNDRNAEMVGLLETDFVGRNEPNYAWRAAVSQILALPGLRGCWPMSSFNENGNTYDLSGQGRVLTNNSVSLYGYDGLAPYVEFDGAADYLSRVSEAGLDIIGTEAYVDSSYQGLTLGGWFYVDTWDAAVTPFMGKWGGANQLSYLLAAVGAGNPRFFVTTDGSTQVSVTSSVARVTDQWFFMVGRFIPSSELSIFINNTETVLAAGVPASIFNSNSQFTIGFEGADTVYLDGNVSLGWLCAQAHSDTIINTLFENQRAMFNV